MAQMECIANLQHVKPARESCSSLRYLMVTVPATRLGHERDIENLVFSCNRNTKYYQRSGWRISLRQAHSNEGNFTRAFSRARPRDFNSMLHAIQCVQTTGAYRCISAGKPCSEERRIWQFLYFCGSAARLACKIDDLRPQISKCFLGQTDCSRSDSMPDRRARTACGQWKRYEHRCPNFTTGLPCRQTCMLAHASYEVSLEATNSYPRSACNCIR